MRTLKDKERMIIVCKIFLSFKGPSTATEIVNYINNHCPVKFAKIPTTRSIGKLLSGNSSFRHKKNKNGLMQYSLKEA